MKRISLAWIVSPACLVILAGLLICAFMAVHWAGWRGQVSILSGTYATTAGSVESQGFRAAVYVSLYFAVMLVVPVFVLASLIQILALRLFLRQSPEPERINQQMVKDTSHHTIQS